VTRLPVEDRGGPLAGVVVVDLTRALAGPYGTMLLADLGAYVLKVEAIGGDLTRGFGPYAEDDQDHWYGGYFQSVNRNKHSISVDLKAPEGRDLVLELVKEADVVVENFRPGVMERLGLSYETLAKINPRLVYGAVRGFGDPRTGESPYVGRPSFDVVAQAIGGVMHITGEADGPPMRFGPGIGDIFPGTLSAVGILAALVDARTTGVGRFVDVAMYDSMVALAERSVYQYSYLGIVPGRVGNEHPVLSPFGLFRASDGWVSIGAPLDHLWRLFCELMGVPDAGTDPRFATMSSRIAHPDEMRELIEAWTSIRSRAEIVDLLADHIPVSSVNTIEDVIEDPHTKVRNMIVDLEQPGSATTRTVVGQAIKYTGSQSHFTRGPYNGEHTKIVLSSIGYSDEQISALHAAGAIHIQSPEGAARP